MSTRQRILETARDLFAQQGYQHTSVREIAERVGLTKTAVLYHFAAKADILTALATPLLDDMEAATGAATSRQEALEALLEVYLTYRHTLRLVLRDLAMFVQEPVFGRFVAAMTRANALVAGPDPSLPEQIRAAQAIAMLSDPVILLADAPTDVLRAEVLAGVHRLLGEPPAPARKKPVRAGRPTAAPPGLVEAARRLQEGGEHTMAEIAAELGVSRATLYRHLARHI